MVAAKVLKEIAAAMRRCEKLAAGDSGRS